MVVGGVVLSLGWYQQDIKAFTALFTTLFISAVGLRWSVSLSLVVTSLRETCCGSQPPCASDHQEHSQTLPERLPVPYQPATGQPTAELFFHLLPFYS